MSPNLATGEAVNVYLVYFYTNYGTNQLRYNGIINLALGISNGFAPGNSTISGTQGDALSLFGSGVVYAQAGYLMKGELFGTGMER